MKYLEVKPNALLADYVKCYWFLEKDYANGQDPAETILPDGCIDLIFQFGRRLHVLANGETHQQPPAFLIGQLKQPMSLASDGVTTTFGIRFYPYGAYPFMPSPLKELVDHTTDLDNLFRGITASLSENIATLSPNNAFMEFERFLLERLANSEIDLYDIGAIMAATRLLYSQNGMLDALSLANYANLSLRSLERKFTEMIGYSPKTLGRILRFNQVKNTLIFHPTMSLTELAHQYHYYDQAHFIHDFQQFTGQTPSAFTAHSAPPAATSSAASAAAAARIPVSTAATESTKPRNNSSSRPSASEPAREMRASSSANSPVVKRTALPRVWR